jgi:hypothetical protein
MDMGQTPTASYWAWMVEPPPQSASAFRCFPFPTTTSQTLSPFSHAPSLVAPTTTASEVAIYLLFVFLSLCFHEN